MVQFLTPEQINAIKRIIAKRHAAVILRVVGPDALAPDERDILQAAGLKFEEQEKAFRESYLYGQFMAQTEKPSVQKMSFEEFKKEAAKRPVTLSAPEEFAVKNAELHAGAHIRHLGAKIEQQASMLIFKEDAEMRSRILRDVKQETAANIQKQESIGKLKKQLSHIQPDWDRDWNRVAITEKTNAMNQGVADSMRKDHGDPWVFKRPMPDACKHCIRLHIGPDGAPRIFKLTVLEGHGTNVGVKAPDWKPVVGTTHPHCQCVISRVPPGWGFDASGDLVPGGDLGVRYESWEAITGAAAAEGKLQKSFKVQNRINFQGLPVAIEHVAGSLRPWKDADGHEGSTRMLFAYGYVEGTVGPDGDEYDVYVGPDPSAPFVFIIHQTIRGSGAYDEDKAMLGFPDPETARVAYAIHYDSPELYFGSMTQMPIEEFVQKVMQTRTAGSFESDGMVKATADIAASGSIMGDRNVMSGGGGPSLVVGAPMVPPGPATRARQIRDLRSFLEQKADRETFMIRGDMSDYLNDQPPEKVHVLELPDLSANEEQFRQDAEDNRIFLDTEIARRLEAPVTNLVIKSGGPYIGPKGGKWADPQHTKPWKPTLVRTPVHAEPEEKTKPKKWKEGYPKGIKPPQHHSWAAGQRGGSEELHWDKETNDFTPFRKQLHQEIFAGFLEKAQSVPEGHQPTAIVTMGGPGSGKSSMLEFLQVDSGLEHKAVLIDADAIKEKLPEYKKAVEKRYKTAAGMVHQESTELATSLRAQALAARKNMIVDQTGANTEKLLGIVNELKAAGYKIHVVMPHLPVKEALGRVASRAEKVGRWVDTEIVEYIHKKVPHNVSKVVPHADSFDLLDNSGDPPPRLVYQKRGEDHTHHDPKTMAKFPGLLEATLKKSEGSKDPITEAVLSALSQAHAKEASLPKKYQAGEGVEDIVADDDGQAIQKETLK